MLDQFAVLKLVTERLDAARIPYMVTGAVAAAYYAEPRTTRDIDIVVELQPQDADRFAAAFADDFNAEPDSIRTAIARRSLFNLIHTEAVVKVDFVVRKDTAYRLEEFRRRRQVTIGGHTIWLASPEDLILSKLAWAKDSRSELQLRDVRQLIRSSQVLDWIYLDRWAAVLTVNEVLQELRR